MSIFRRVVVLLDQPTPQGRAFTQGLNWAMRLQIPMLGIAPIRWGNFRSSDFSELTKPSALRARLGNIGWQLTRWPEQGAAGLIRFAGAEDLFVFCHETPAARKKELLREMFEIDAPATLICGDRWGDSGRALVLDHGRAVDEGFLRTAALLCSEVRMTPVVVSIAGTEAAARIRQQSALQVLAECQVEAHFDYFVGCEVCSGVARIARLRNCQMVIGSREARAPWWHWLRDNTAQELIFALDSSSFLALSEVNCRADLLVG